MSYALLRLSDDREVYWSYLNTGGGGSLARFGGHPVQVS